MIGLLSTGSFLIILVSIIMGIRAMVICAPRLLDFNITHLDAMISHPGSLKDHPPFWSWVYPLCMGFTLLEIIAFLARMRWATDVGWQNAGEMWALIWLMWHAVAALLIAWFHFGIIRVFRAYAAGGYDE